MNNLTTKPSSLMEKAGRVFELSQIIKDAKVELDAYREELLQATQEMDVYTLKTGNYTLYRAKRITPKIDFKRLKATLDKEEIPYETEEVFAPHMMTTFKEAIKQKRELDGLEALETEYVGVRLSDKK